MIYEVIITTVNANGSVHMAPMGIWKNEGKIIISPYRPSATLENIKRTNKCIVNSIDDVIICGSITP